MKPDYDVEIDHYYFTFECEYERNSCFKADFDVDNEDDFISRLKDYNQDYEQNPDLDPEVFLTRISFAQSSRTDFSGIENWDTSHVTDMSGMFYCCDRFNQDISSWDVSSVKDMSHMFWGCKQFNQYIGSWDVGNVKEMQDMFLGCENFDQDLNDWCVREDCIVTGLFAGCDKHSYKNIANAFSKNQISIIGRDLDYMARELEQTKSKTGVLRR